MKGTLKLVASGLVSFFAVWFLPGLLGFRGALLEREVKERELLDLTRGHRSKILKNGQQVFAK
jgi:hypothetical protein